MTTPVYEPDSPPMGDEMADYIYKELKRIADGLNTINEKLVELETRLEAVEP